jgi:hypothetical protein
MKKMFFSLLFLVAAWVVSSCASDPSREPATFGGSDTSRAHPASYFIDNFTINRPLPAHHQSNHLEFYFKRCNMAGDNWPISYTRYDCEYP